MIMEEAAFDLARELKVKGQAKPPVALRYWDDHAKWSADNKRGYDKQRSVKLRRDNCQAPVSDMGNALAGGKAVTNSILVITPPGVYAADVEDAWPVSVKRDEPCHKQAYAVTRLEMERRSTPTQQTNDWLYLLHADAVRESELQRLLSSLTTQLLRHSVWRVSRPSARFSSVCRTLAGTIACATRSIASCSRSST